VEFEVFTSLFINTRVLWDMVNQHGNIQTIAIFSVITQYKLFYKLKDNMTVIYHACFLLNSTLLFPEYSFYSFQHITSILYLFVWMSTTSQVHSKLISIFYIKPIKRIPK